MIRRGVPNVLTSLAVVVVAGCGGGGSGTSNDGGESRGGAESAGDGGGSQSGDKAPSTPTAGAGNGYQYAFSPTSAMFDCADSLDAILGKGAAHVTIGSATIVVGSEQVGSNDQDPIVARYDGKSKVFCEHSKKGGGIDGRAYGLTWDGGSTLYVVYTIVGGGTLFDTAASSGWLRSYGDGGASAKATVVGKVNTDTGVVEKATYIESKLVRNGQMKTNTLVPADAVHVTGDGLIEFFGSPAYCTLNPDKSLMCDPNVKSDYPKKYRARFTADLATMTCASAEGVSVVKQPCP